MQFTTEFHRVQCWGHSCLSFTFYLLAISFGIMASTFTVMLMTLSSMCPQSTLLLSPPVPSLHVSMIFSYGWQTTTSNSAAVKLNILLIGTKTTLSKTNICSIAIANATMPVSTQVKSLGVILDSTLSFPSHINNVSRIAFFHLRNISRLHHALTQHSTEVLVNALVTSRIDYCNAILVGIPSKLINRLQLVQNAAARII